MGNGIPRLASSALLRRSPGPPWLEYARFPSCGTLPLVLRLFPPLGLGALQEPACLARRIEVARLGARLLR